jgi:predicted GNAT superfamily acetyltransferase
MRCLITVKVTISNEEIFDSVMQIMKENGGVITGTFEKGIVEIKTKYGRFEGNYFYKYNNLQLVITQKPLVIPSTMLKSKILNFFVNYNLDNMLSIFEEKLTFA